MSTIPQPNPGASVGVSQDSPSTLSPREGIAGTAGAAGTSTPVMLIGGAVLLLTFGWVFSDFLATQWRWAIRNPADWGHTLAIPLIAGYFVYLRREQLAAIGARTTWFGFVPLLLGVGWYLLCIVGPQTLAHHNLRGAGFGIALFGLVLLVFGWRAMAILWFPIVYLVAFGQTVSQRLMDLLTLKLQDYAAIGSHAVLNLIGIDTDRSGNVLTVWSSGVPHPLNIAEACSGMRMLVAFLALGVAMAYTGLPRLWQRVALVGLGIPVALAVNVLRVVTLGILSIWDMDFASGEFHNMIGLVWLVPAFLIYLGILWILRSLVVEEDAPGATPAGGKV